MKINLELDAAVEYEYEPAYGNETPGGTEHIPATLMITSVKSENGIELISLLSEDELVGLEETLLNEKLNP